jgi:hypothetical protein
MSSTATTTPTATARRTRWTSWVGDARALGDQVAAWFTQHHQALNVKYIIWWGEIIDYRDVSPAWGPCKKPVSSCATLHFDHVHVSFTA